jgi:hypothetical protein
MTELKPTEIGRVTVEKVGRAPSGQALVSDEAPAGLHPPGFDPSRIGLLVRALLSVSGDVRRVMVEMGDGESCPTAACIEAETKVPAKRVREIMRALRTLGLAEYGPLCDVDSESYAPRGSGYWLWPHGFEFLRAIDTAEAIAIETEGQDRGTGLGAKHESAGPKDIAHD